ncbi:hypothetical protein B7463_g11159, partial [Scytalidium lignicola]
MVFIIKLSQQSKLSTTWPNLTVATGVPRDPIAVPTADPSVWTSSSSVYSPIPSNPIPYVENFPLHHRRLLYQHAQLSLQARLPEGCISFYSVAAKFPFAKHALISNSAFIIHSVTGDPATEAIAAEERTATLRGLQLAINNFSIENTDAIIATSLCLAWSAPDWQHWEIFLSGLARVLESSRDWKDNVLFSPLYQGDFILLNLPPKFGLEQAYRDQPVHYQIGKLLLVMSELESATERLSLEDRKAAGFDRLSTLRMVIETASRAQSESETFHALSLLRHWMFWITLTPCPKVDESRLIFLAQFYLTVWSAVPMFPRHFAAHIASTCSRLIQGLKRHPSLPHDISRALSSLS